MKPPAERPIAHRPHPALSSPGGTSAAGNDNRPATKTELDTLCGSIEELRTTQRMAPWAPGHRARGGRDPGPGRGDGCSAMDSPSTAPAEPPSAGRVSLRELGSRLARCGAPERFDELLHPRGGRRCTFAIEQVVDSGDRVRLRVRLKGDAAGP